MIDLELELNEKFFNYLFNIEVFYNRQFLQGRWNRTERRFIIGVLLGKNNNILQFAR